MSGSQLVVPQHELLHPAAIKIPPPLASDRVFTTFASGHGFTVTQGGTGGDDLNHAASAMLSAQGLKLVTDGAGTAKRVDKTSGLSIDLRNYSPVMWLWVENVAHLNALEVWFGSGGYGTAYRFAPHNVVASDPRQDTLQEGSKIRLAMSWQSAVLISTFGTPTKGSLDAIRIAVQDDGVQAVTVHIGGIGAMPEPRPVWPHGVVSFTMDDGFAAQYTSARPALAKYGFRSTHHVICDLVDSGASYMSKAQLLSLQNEQGCQIAMHAFAVAAHNTSGGYPALGAEAMERDVTRALTWFRENGFEDSEDMAWPQGYFDDATLEVARKYCRSGRSTIARTQEVWPPAEPFKLRVRNVSNVGESGGPSVATVQGYIDDAFTNAYWLILVFHDFNASPTSGLQCTPANFQLVVDRAATIGIPVRTTRDVLAARQSRHAPAHAPGGPDDLYIAGGNTVTGGTETLERDRATAGTTTAGGRVALTYFTPALDRLFTKIKTVTGGTTPSGITHARMGLYTVAASGNLTLVAAVADDATAFAAASTEYERSLDTGGSLPASYTLLAGQRYAYAQFMTGTTAPNFFGCVPLLANTNALEPRLAASLNGQTDLPTSISAGSLSNSNQRMWAYFS